MKMNLKSPKQKWFNKKFFKLQLNNKNLVIFLSSLFVVSILAGMFFFFYIKSSDKEALEVSIKSFFEVPNSIDYFGVLKDNSINYIFDFILIWILGLSVIGIVFVLFLFFSEGFSIGFALAGIFKTYGFKGIIASFTYLIPTRIVYLLGLFIITFFASKISYKIIKLLFSKSEVSMKTVMRQYIKILIICLVIAALTSVFKTFVDPFMIKFFTFF